ncbi:MAG: Ribonuclease HII [Candidatus Bathyarchaeota archaeon BA2]|nr:MAG: Ribonuclease HII [Candidatus Bathyarchaeota archaeon BA2]
MSMDKLSKYEAIVGSDEAGKGEWLGPLTVAAIAITSAQGSYLVTQGVMDSKELKIERVMELSGIITKECLGYHVITISPRKFNKLLQEVKKEGKSLNDILAWGHAKAISEVYRELQNKKILGRVKLVIDEFDKLKTEERLGRVLKLTNFDLEQRPRAEEETAVAAASILARALREFWIDDASKRLNLDLRKLSVTEALTHKDIEYFAKVSFLHRK